MNHPNQPTRGRFLVGTATFFLDSMGLDLKGLMVAVLLILFVAGCATEPVNPVTVATRVPSDANMQPTPTLVLGAPTRPLPTPPITPSPEASESQAETAQASSSEPLTATPEISERLNLGQESLTVGNYAAAIEQISSVLLQDPLLEPESQNEALFQLGAAYLAEGEAGDAATMFNQLLGLAGEEAPAAAHFYLAQASISLGDYKTAISAYQAYLDLQPDMAAYVYPLIAEAYLALGESGAALEAYEAALTGNSHRIKEYETRLILAGNYLADGDYEAAIDQYDAILEFAQTENTKGQMIYLAGAAELQAGNTDAAYERFITGVSEYPGVYESYLGLVELVKAEVPVDDYQRGVVDFNAAAYAPGIEAFLAHMAVNPDDYQPDAHLYLAWSYEALDDLETASVELDQYAEYEPSTALFEQAKMRTRVGETDTAIELYQQFLTDYPEDEEAPLVAWKAAALIEQVGDVESAIEQYLFLAEVYPDHEDAPEALYQAGWLAHNNDDKDTALDLWQRAAEEYTESRYGSAALVRLLRAERGIEDDLLTDLQELAVNNGSDQYPALRARDMAEGIEPFSSSSPFSLPTTDLTDQEEAETWLLDQLEAMPEDLDGPPGKLGPELLEDEGLLVGEKLWELGRFEEAKRELEAVRESHSESLLESYRLALFFRDLGLYRSSIIAGATVLDLAGQSAVEAPPFIGRLAYPAYYSEQILPLAEEYGFDPRLQFSLVRQESLFESFARSGAVAQGLSQVIPDTGAWIAEELQWPDYENADLYKPHVGLEFGAFYLAEQLEEFDGDVHAALAAYNAGPGNAARWHEVAGGDLDQFIDEMDFWETRTYVERIYAGFDIYRSLYEP